MFKCNRYYRNGELYGASIREGYPANTATADIKEDRGICILSDYQGILKFRRVYSSTHTSNTLILEQAAACRQQIVELCDNLGL